ncbi:MAG TPA: hypothetical protein PKM16_11035 [Bacteroidia bacterium]|nr:hypothetical protein [Bacteroidia bacterium]
MKKLICLLLIWVITMISTPLVVAQCSMCRAVAESNVDSNKNNVGRGLNNGILYLLSIPYILGGTAVGIWYYHKKKQG